MNRLLEWIVICGLVLATQNGSILGTESTGTRSRTARQVLDPSLRLGQLQAVPLMRSLTSGLREGLTGLGERVAPVLNRGIDAVTGTAQTHKSRLMGVINDYISLSASSESESSESAEALHSPDSDETQARDFVDDGRLTLTETDSFESYETKDVESHAEHNLEHADEPRAIGGGFLGSALYALGKFTLGQGAVDRITPVVQGLQQFTNALPAVEFKDGKIVRVNSTTTAVTPVKKESSTSLETTTSKPQYRTCTTPTGGLGKCQDLSSCPSLLLDLANLRKSICFQSLFVPGVCCPEGSSSEAANLLVSPVTTTDAPVTLKRTTTTPKTTTTTTEAPEAPEEEEVSAPDEEDSSQEVTSFSQARCGQVLVRQAKVVGGEASSSGEWPWMAAIYLHGPLGTEFWCGGSLINERYILTAAHCTRDGKQKQFSASQYTVKLGSHDLQEADAGEVYGVSEIRVHPQFSGYGFYNDLALFRLDRPVKYSDYVQPVCLPEGQLRSSTFLGEIPTVTGWGTTYYGGRESPLLRQVELPVWRNEDCDRSYFQPITEVFLCAGYADGGRDACQGDSGGPLVLKKGNSWVQIGLVSFGNKCAEPGFPGVYTRLTRFIDWIHSNTV